MKKLIFGCIACCIATLTLYSGYRVWGIQREYRDEAAMREQAIEFKPADGDELVNQSVIDLQAKYPDAVGWLRIPNTRIDYPFVWYKDNDFYLRRDLDGKTATAGTAFMDYRCEKAFTSQNTILYGHHMKNGSMFGTLNSFADNTFFDANPSGTIYLPRETLTLEFFAYMVISHRDTEIYSVDLSESYFDYVKQYARQYRDISLTGEDRIVMLSTCGYEFENARLVLLAKVG